LIYTYTFVAGPRPLRRLFKPVVAWAFDRQTERRFARLHAFLSLHAAEVARWQAEEGPPAHESDARG
jgi:hypothetical protein